MLFYEELYTNFRLELNFGFTTFFTLSPPFYQILFVENLFYSSSVKVCITILRVTVYGTFGLELDFNLTICINISNHKIQ